MPRVAISTARPVDAKKESREKPKFLGERARKQSKIEKKNIGTKGTKKWGNNSRN